MNSECYHHLRNFIQVASGAILSSMKTRRDLRITLKKNECYNEEIGKYLCLLEENDADFLLRLKQIEEVLREERGDGNGDNV